MHSSVVRKIPGISITLKWLFVGPQSLILKDIVGEVRLPDRLRTLRSRNTHGIAGLQFLSPSMKAMPLSSWSDVPSQAGVEVIRRESFEAAIFESLQFLLSGSVT